MEYRGSEDGWRKPSVYQILNLVTGDCYVGASIDPRRGYGHHKGQFKRGRHNGIILEAYRTYGIDAFAFIVLEQCDEKALHEREQYYFDLLKPTYHWSLDASLPNKGRPMLEQQKLKTAATIKRKYDSGYVNPQRGRKQTSTAQVAARKSLVESRMSTYHINKDGKYYLLRADEAAKLTGATLSGLRNANTTQRTIYGYSVRKA